MPELPEVETIRMGLQKYLVGKKIAGVDVKYAKSFQGDVKDVIGATVSNVDRVGKVLIIELNNGFSIVAHLKMTGQIIYRKVSKEGKVPKVPKGEPGRLSKKIGGKLSERVGELPNKFTRVIFKFKSPHFALSKVEWASAGKQNSKFKDDSYLYFNDIRKFGWIRIVQSSKLKVQSFIKDLGPEPFVGQASSGQATLTLRKFGEVVRSSNRPIKIILMDQGKIAGVGNIYANEALFLAKIDPRRKATSLTEAEIKVLYKSIIEVLKKGIKYGGSSDVNYVNALGQDGHYQEHFLVYGRTGEKCFNCSGKVQKIKLGGRGTYFCSKCQI